MLLYYSLWGFSVTFLYHRIAIKGTIVWISSIKLYLIKEETLLDTAIWDTATDPTKLQDSLFVCVTNGISLNYNNNRTNENIHKQQKRQIQIELSKKFFRMKNTTFDFDGYLFKQNILILMSK